MDKNDFRLRYERVRTHVAASFWRDLRRHVVEEWRLDGSPKALIGALAVAPCAARELGVHIGAWSLSDDAVPALTLPLPGTLLLADSAAAFREVDKQAALDAAAAAWWAAAADPRLPPPPTLPWLLVCWPNVKESKFLAWAAFPAPVLRGGAGAVVRDVCQPRVVSSSPLRRRDPGSSAVAAGSGVASLSDATVWRLLQLASGGGWPPCGIVVAWAPTSGDATPVPFGAFTALQQHGAAAPHPVFVLFDGVCTDGGAAAAGAAGVVTVGWAARNALTLLGLRCGGGRYDLVLLRPTAAAATAAAATAAAAATTTAAGVTDDNELGRLLDGDASIALVVELQPPPLPTVTDAPPGLPADVTSVGWETNAAGTAPGPRLVDLAASGGNADAPALAAAAAKLNLQLMGWRMLPELDVPLLARTRVALIGAGTLGCNVARVLLGWGISRLTFVDDGRVALSNPVRQPLFEHADAVGGGGGGGGTGGAKLKAQAAAEAVRRILPGASVAWHALRVPMPGHAVADSDAPRVAADVATLAALVAASDAVFLLTDTRESRWLPTLLCAAAGVPAITVGLGFDSLLVLRHGVHGDDTALTRGQPPTSAGGPAHDAAVAAARASAAPLARDRPDALSDGVRHGGGGQAGESGGRDAERAAAAMPVPLACYFCADAAAPPGNSTARRTLDQQCSAVRAGAAPIAAALASELLVALLHHPRGFRAAAEPACADTSAPTRSPLGLVPHAMRFFLSHYAVAIAPSAPARPSCCACGPRVRAEFAARGAALVVDVANGPPALLDALAGGGAADAAAAADAADADVLAFGVDEDVYDIER